MFIHVYVYTVPRSPFAPIFTADYSLLRQTKAVPHIQNKCMFDDIECIQYFMSNSWLMWSCEFVGQFDTSLSFFQTLRFRDEAVAFLHFHSCIPLCDLCAHGILHQFLDSFRLDGQSRQSVKRVGGQVIQRFRKALSFKNPVCAFLCSIF